MTVTWVWRASIHEFIQMPSGVHLATDSAADDRQKAPPQTPSPVTKPSLPESFNQSAKTMPQNILPECCQQEILAEIKKLEDQLPGNLTYAIPKSSLAENINPNARPGEGDEPNSVVPNTPKESKPQDGDVSALPNASGVPDLAAPNLPSPLDVAGGVSVEFPVPARMRLRIKKRGGMMIRRVRRVVFKAPVLSVVLGRQLAKPTADALAIIARGGSVAVDAVTAVPAPVLV